MRQGFDKLLEQKLKNRKPKLKLGGGKSETIRKFKTNGEADLNLLLIDLDKPESEIEKDLKDNDLLDDRDNVFYMIQEMESWFISQPNVLDEHYPKDLSGKLISSKIPKKHASEIENPDEKLKSWTKGYKHPYHKIKDAVLLLQKLDANQLEKDFPEFDRLIKKLSS